MDYMDDMDYMAHRDIEKDLAVVDLLCTRDFPAERGRTDVGEGGPGYFITPLGASTWANGEELAEDLYAYEIAMAERLSMRWGEPLRWGTVTIGERIARGEEIPEPWALLSALADDLRTWKATHADRWVTVAAADREAEVPSQLLLVVTDIDPP
jgi:hypothetical protein